MEASKKNETQKTENTAKSLNGTEQHSNWKKAAELIAGDDQLLSTLLRIILSPFTLIAGAGVIIYLLFKNKTYKEELSRLKKENTKLLNEKSYITGQAETFRKKYKKLEKVFEIEQGQPNQLLLPQGNNREIPKHNINKNKVSFLD
jgi:uncharacterized protein HemX